MKRLTAFTLLVALALGSAVAFAQDTYPGYTCITNSDFMHRAGSKYENTDAGASHTAACPVVRNNMIAGLASGSSAVVFDQHWSDDVSCTLAAKSSSGGSVAFSTRATLGSSPAAQSLSFGSLPLVAGGHYSLYCTVPAEYQGARSSIVSYSILD